MDEGAGLLESASDTEVVVQDSRSPNLGQRATARTAVAVATVAGLLIVLSLGSLGEGSGQFAFAGHFLGLSREDELCKEYQQDLMKAAERMGMIQLSGMVRRTGCAVNATSKECFEEKEKIDKLFPRCDDEAKCSKAMINLTVNATNLTIFPPRVSRREKRLGSRPQPIHINQVFLQVSRTKNFPRVCEGQLKKLVEGDAHTSGSIFNSTDFCNLDVTGLPVPQLEDCKKLELAPQEDLFQCNRLERFVGKKLRIWKVGFTSRCQGSFEIRE